MLILTSSWTFYTPGQPKALCWKYIGNHYKCTLPIRLGKKDRTIAILVPAHTTSKTTLFILVKTTSEMPITSTYRGVDSIMMLHLIIGAILVSTDHFPTATTSLLHYPSTPIQIASKSMDLMNRIKELWPSRHLGGKTIKCSSSIITPYHLPLVITQQPQQVSLPRDDLVTHQVSSLAPPDEIQCLDLHPQTLATLSAAIPPPPYSAFEL